MFIALFLSEYLSCGQTCVLVKFRWRGRSDIIGSVKEMIVLELSGFVLSPNGPLHYYYNRIDCRYAEVIGVK